jgi:hypothetical protein
MPRYEAAHPHAPKSLAGFGVVRHSSEVKTESAGLAQWRNRPGNELLGLKNNLLLALHTYAPQQNQNFPTEAFVHLLRHLQIHEPPIACALFQFLTSVGFSAPDSSLRRMVRFLVYEALGPVCLPRKNPKREGKLEIGVVDVRGLRAANIQRRSPR